MQTITAVHQFAVDNTLTRAIIVRMHTKSGKQFPPRIVSSGTERTFSWAEPLYYTIYDPSIGKVIHPKGNTNVNQTVNITRCSVDAYLMHTEELHGSEKTLNVYNYCENRAFILQLSSGEEYNIQEDCVKGRVYTVKSGTNYKIIAENGAVMCQGRVTVRDVHVQLSEEIYCMRTRMSYGEEEEEEEEAVQVEA